MALVVKTQPTVEPVTLTEMKLHSRIDHTDEDTLLTSLIAVARQYCETFTGRVFVTQTLEYSLNNWPSGQAIYLPCPPVQEVDAVKYTDSDGGTTALTEGTDYIVDTDSTFARVVLPLGVSWPSAVLYEVNPIVIEYTAGYPPEDGEPTDYRANIPEYIKAAIKLFAASLYENREAVLPAGHIGRTLPMGLESLLWQHRVFWTPELNK